MDIKNIFAHFDKKVTDFKIWVNKVIIEQNNKLKTFQDYLVNTLDSHKKLITDFIEENAGGVAGGDLGDFDLITGSIECDGNEGWGEITLNLTKPYKEILFQGAETEGSVYLKKNGVNFFGNGGMLPPCIRVKISGGILTSDNIYNECWCPQLIDGNIFYKSETINDFSGEITIGVDAEYGTYGYKIYAR